MTTRRARCVVCYSRNLDSAQHLLCIECAKHVPSDFDYDRPDPQQSPDMGKNAVDEDMVHVNSNPPAQQTSKIVEYGQTNFANLAAQKEAEGPETPTQTEDANFIHVAETGNSPTVVNAPTTANRKRKRARPSTYARKKRKVVVEQPPPPESIICPICVEEKVLDEFPRIRRGKSSEVPASCQRHLAINGRGVCSSPDGPYCKTCIGSTLAASLDTRGRALTCPQAGCNVPWGYDYVVPFLPRDQLERYHDGLVDDLLLTPMYFRCTHCDIPSQLDKRVRGFPNVECGYCTKRSCALCSVAWHEDLNCQQFWQKDMGKTGISDQEKATLRVLSKTGARICPRCQNAIEKNGGCEHMLCTRCNHNFYWSTAEQVNVPGAKIKKVKVQPFPPHWLYNGQQGCEADNKNQTNQTALGFTFGAPVPVPQI
ncbi:hypothetical protein M501DRAFT_91111 [Patellaria atrata CBS 101060]|uniref:RBR-type E3 ubiquitin transferase n=1 Tax=Patellaria atrata CBS 101060 TaxID=1346257 RepID=A0A9P4SJM1_9PEZI|nr:hypothetical protein M501DRAFT_91111 [Patellaria atrata CBS 101060]